MQSSEAARVFRGQAEEARGARRWIQALTAAACVLAAEDTELAAAELFANAIMHTRSGAAGGKVMIVVAPDRDGMTVHVHDQGADDSQVPVLLSCGNESSLVASGRGLRIVDAICGGRRWGTGPAICCPHGAADDPAVQAYGYCVWFQLPTGTS